MTESGGSSGSRRRGRSRRYGPEATDGGGDRDLEAAPDSDPEETARAICLRLLEARPRSRRELADALQRRGAPDDVAARVLDRFVEVGLIDDAEYARMITRSRVAERGLARRAVAAELRRRGVGDAEALDALSTLDPAVEADGALRLATKRHKTLTSLPLDVQRRRLAGYLGRRGYDSDTVWRTVTAVTGES